MGMVNTDWILIVFVLGLVAISGIVAWRSLATTSISTIDVNGDASTMLQANKADVTITVETDSDSALNSQQTNADLSDKVKKGVLAVGLNNSDIETSYYHLNIVRTYDRDGNVTSLFYRTTHSFTVKLNEQFLNKTGAVIDIAVAMGANRIDGVSFGLSEVKQKEVKSQLLLDATRDARTKAEAIANQSGSKIIGVSRINEGYSYVTSTRNMAPEAAMYKSADTPISPGQVSVSASVSASYKIE